MKWIRACIWAACAMGVSAMPAGAQDATPGGPTFRSDHPITLSLGATGVLTWISSGADLRFTIGVPVSERVSLDFFGAPYRGTENEDLGLDVKGFYGMQVRLDIDRGRRTGVTPFLTFGGAGVVYRDQPTNCFLDACVRTEPTRVLPPVLGLVGAGVEYVVNPHLAVRVEVQGIVALVLPAGARVSIGVSIPLGHRFPAVMRAASK